MAWAIGFALLVYLPILGMDVGRVEADTKAYLYLDAGRLLGRAGSLWDPSFGMGTLTHQTIGYLFPMGPWFWFFQQIVGLPAWVTERLWLGTIVFLAGMGVWYLLRTFRVTGVGVAIGMVTYAFSPYILGYSAVSSVLLGPWAALPWWIAFAARGVRRGGWKYPALFALTVQLVGALNGSALMFALIGPALWILYAAMVTREATWRRAWAVTWRTGLLTMATSLWWASALLVEGQYGVNILRFTESLEAVSTSSFPFEVLRGLGFWFFYGGDGGGPWIQSRASFTQRPVMLFVSLAIPALALLGAALIRWRERAYFATLVVVGVVMAVGAAPYDHPSWIGSIFKTVALGSKAGLALRNSNRAVPLVALGLSVLLAVGVTTVFTRLRALGRSKLAYLSLVLVGGICLVNAAPLLNGGYYNPSLERRPEIPAYWKAAIAHLASRSSSTRVLALPGSDFASYRWGDMRDPVEPGLMDRPYVARELVPWGSEQSAAFLAALDQRVQQGSIDPNSLAQIARLMGVGDIVLRMDLQTDRYNLISAPQLWHLLTGTPVAGLDAPLRFGTKIPGTLRYPPFPDLSRPVPVAENPPPVAILGVRDKLPILRAKSTATPLVVAGDSEGLLDASAAGLLDATRVVLYSAPYAKRPQALRARSNGATLVITDSNRRRGRRWSGMSGQDGYTEQAGERALKNDPLDQRLDVFPGASDATRTVTVLDGARSVRATSYGAPNVGLTPSQRPSTAFDGDRSTGWLVDAGLDIRPERLRVALERPVTTGHIRFVQPSKAADKLARSGRRYISKLGLRFDGGPWIERALPVTSRTKKGAVIEFPRRTFSTVEIRIDGVAGFGGFGARRNPVGLNEVSIQDDSPGSRPVRVREWTLMPRDLLASLGRGSAEHPLDLVISREATMDQRGVDRQFELPTTRQFQLSGSAVLSGFAKDPVIDRTFGLPDAVAGGVTASSSARLGNPITRASSAIDDDLSTAWTTPVGFVHAQLRLRVPRPITLDHLDLQVVADGSHSLPAQLAIRADGGAPTVVDVPQVPRNIGTGGVATVPISFPALPGSDFRIKIKAVRKVKRQGQTLPVGIAELGIAGVHRLGLPVTLPNDCLEGLLKIDGSPVSVRVSGSVADALAGKRLPVTACDASAMRSLAPGSHRVSITVAPRADRAFDIGQLVLSSPAPTSSAPIARHRAPSLRVIHNGRTSTKLRITGNSSGFWLVMGQSFNTGWVARANGVDLGEPELVDGYANGWRVPRSPHGRPVTISLEWQPQRVVRLATWISLAAGIACLAIVLLCWVRRRSDAADEDEREPTTLGAEPDPLAAGPIAKVAIVVVAFLAGAALVEQSVGVILAGYVFLMLWRRGWRTILRFVPAIIVGFVAIYIPIAQLLRHYPPTFYWAANYDNLRAPTWTAVLMLGADALLEILGRAVRSAKKATRAHDIIA